MGIFNWFHNPNKDKQGKDKSKRETRRIDHIAELIAHIEGIERKNNIRAGTDLAQKVREYAEELGDDIFEVYITSVGSVGTFSSKENVRKFLEKYNELKR